MNKTILISLLASLFLLPIIAAADKDPPEIVGEFYFEETGNSYVRVKCNDATTRDCIADAFEHSPLQCPEGFTVLRSSYPQDGDRQKGDCEIEKKTLLGELYIGLVCPCVPIDDGSQGSGLAQ